MRGKVSIRPIIFGKTDEFCIETRLSAIGMSNYKRILSVAWPLAVMLFAKDNVAYQRKFYRGSGIVPWQD